MESLHFYRDVPLYLTPWSPVSMEIEPGLDTAREIVTIPDDINREGLPALCYAWMVITIASPRVQVGERERDERGKGERDTEEMRGEQKRNKVET